jgi:transposase
VVTLTSAVRIWLATEPVDIRLSFRGLSGLVRQRLQDDPLSGHLFCFVNVRRTMMKLLLFDRTGYWIFYKRIEKGVFHRPHLHDDARTVTIDAIELAGSRRRLAATPSRERRGQPMLDGIDLRDDRENRP